MGGVDGGQGGADACGSQCPRVAVGQDGGIIGDELLAVQADGVAHPTVFGFDRFGLGKQGFFELAGAACRISGQDLSGGAGHAVQCPEQVDRGRAALSEVIGGFQYCFEGFCGRGGIGEFAAGYANTIRGGHSDGGGASNGQGDNGLEKLLGSPAGEVFHPAGQLPLVEQFEDAVCGTGPSQGFKRFYHNRL